MSMLAERKQKQKWSLNPRGKAWSQDGNKFGQKMLEKMGWQQGKGLGRKQDGIVEHIKVAYKNDSKGMGYKESDNQWTKHETNFSALLESLGGNTEKPDKVKLNSLEKKSQSSKARVHYHKFTRGKDLSRYSEKDLANIFGKKTLKAETKIQETEIAIDTEQSTKQQSDQPSYLLNAGSMMDYFKSKLPNLSKQNGLSNSGGLRKNDSDSECETRPSFGFGFKSENDNTKLPTFVSYVAETAPKRKADDDIMENNIFSPKKKLKKGKENDSGTKNTDYKPVNVEKHIMEPNNETCSEQSFISEECVVINTVADVHRENSMSEHKSPKNKRKKSKSGKTTAEDLEIYESSNSITNETDTSSGDHQIRNCKKSKKNMKSKATIIENHNDSLNLHHNLHNPVFDIASSEAIESVENPYEFKPKQKKKKKNKAEFDNPTFENNDDLITDQAEIEVNPYEVKIKKKRKKDYENPTFQDLAEDSSISVISEDNPYEVRPKNKKKKGLKVVATDVVSTDVPEIIKQKKKKKQKLSKNEISHSVDSVEAKGIENPALNLSNHSDTIEKENSDMSQDNPYEIKPKNHKRKKLSNLGTNNIECLDVPDSINHKKNKKKGKKIEKNDSLETSEMNGIANEGLNLSNLSDSIDIVEDSALMLNIVSKPIEEKKPAVGLAGSIKRIKKERRKSVRFSDIIEKRIIPNNDDIRRMSSVDFMEGEDGIDNVGFDIKKAHLDEKIQTLSKDIESCQAEIENDINENKIKTVQLEDMMVGEVGNPHGEDEKLPDGTTRLKFKNAHFQARTPFYQMKQVGPKKSYKHLIKGDIVLQFNNTNLHEIQGYARNNNAAV